MMRTPRHLDTHAEELLQIWHAGWGLRLHRTPIGVFFRLESGVLFRGGRISGWWWRLTTGRAVTHAADEATSHPRPGSLRPASTSTYDDAEWEN